ncbi:MAG: hypothetical protein ACYDB2_04840 [Acidimicrobiales bacterium]
MDVASNAKPEGIEENVGGVAFSGPCERRVVQHLIDTEALSVAQSRRIRVERGWEFLALSSTNEGARLRRDTTRGPTLGAARVPSPLGKFKKVRGLPRTNVSTSVISSGRGHRPSTA